ncbi:HK97 family phage prohead protease [Pseudolactococcus carnosus]|uniref:HK97 family phage prohead protease n=1 Tax=Pseudolactococcus carnosus TaxID=2749961 RepID=A0ABT0AQP9_9LACT|nr:HK97 family phage prohead protease [Lactococcus carnosus]MCJ1989033.1 HK97 family phage prohead protease [Lactococcus carnosus]
MTEKRRMAFTSQLKTRAVEENNEAYIEGYFVVYNSETELFDGAFEEIQAGALDESIANNNVVALDNHDTRIVLGSTDSQTVELKSDEKGLWARIKIDLEDPNAKSAYQKVKNGLVTGCSFGFNPLEETTENRADGSIKWVVTKAEILEISTTVFPAYKDTNVEARHKQFDELSTRNKQRNLQTRKQQLKERIKQWH